MINRILKEMATGNSQQDVGSVLTTEHILLECLDVDNPNYDTDLVDENKKNVRLLESAGCNVSNLCDYLEARLHSIGSGYSPLGHRSSPKRTPTLDAIIDNAAHLQQMLEPARVPDLKFKFFVASIYDMSQTTKDTELAIILQSCGLNWTTFMRSLTQKVKDAADAAAAEENKSMVETLCENLSQKAADKKLLPVVGREEEVLKVIEILAKRQKNAAVLLGKAGTGKTAVAEGLAIAIEEKQVPEYLYNSKVFVLTMTDMVAGTKFRGEFEAKMKQLLAELRDMKKDGSFPILFIDEIHTIMGAGAASGSAVDVANMLKPAIARGEIAVIGATTNEEWAKHVAPDKAMKRRFTVVDIDEPTKAQTLVILKGIKDKFEAHHGVTYTDDALEHCVNLSVDFMQETALPDKAIELMDYTGSYSRRIKTTVVGHDEVEFALSRRNKIPLDSIRSQKKNAETEYQALAEKVKEKVFGQDDAVAKVAEKMEEYIAGMNAKNKPIGAFLMVGPTGVGKTEVAVQLANYTKFNFVRLDMSDYMEPHSVAKLIGSPAGYVRSDEQGRLEKELEKNPQTILLLDEMEKAHPDIQKIFLQILDNGKIVSSSGNTVDFTKCMILMTSNVGARAIHEKVMGLVETNYKDRKINENDIKNQFLPEFLGRLNALGGVVHFNALDASNMIQIVKKVVAEISTDNLTPQGVTLSVSNEAVKWLVDKTYTPEFGARNIKAGVDNNIKKVITRSILSGEVKAGKKNVSVSVEKDALQFKYTT